MRLIYKVTMTLFVMCLHVGTCAAISVKADHIEWQREAGLVTGAGNVTFEVKNLTIKAGRFVGHLKNADGNLNDIERVNFYDSIDLSSAQGRLTAKEGVYFRDSQALEVYGKQIAFKGKGLDLQCSKRLKWDQAKNMVNAEGQVKATRDGNTVCSETLTMHLGAAKLVNDQQLHLSGNVALATEQGYFKGGKAVIAAKGGSLQLSGGADNKRVQGVLSMPEAKGNKP